MHIHLDHDLLMDLGLGAACYLVTLSCGCVHVLVTDASGAGGGGPEVVRGSWGSIQMVRTVRVL